MADHYQKLAQLTQQGSIATNLSAIIRSFFDSYGEAVKENGYEITSLQPILCQFLDLVSAQLAHPYAFDPFHERITSPIDFHRFGLEILRPLIIFSECIVRGLEHVNAMEKALAKGENIILFANHQTEPDPQAINLLLEKTHPQFAEQMIFVAGQRVVSDPLAVPFSQGCNLLCIYSKRYIETEPELKLEKLSHNQRTMKKMAQLLGEGGKCIYVAPSGGRDRADATGKIAVAAFDAQSIEMFWLMTQQSHHKTHFHPLALATYDLLPPPNSIETNLGERRHARSTPIHLSFGPPIDMKNCVPADITDKKLRRKMRAEYIWKLVVDQYAHLRLPKHI